MWEMEGFEDEGGEGGGIETKGKEEEKEEHLGREKAVEGGQEKRRRGTIGNPFWDADEIMDGIFLGSKKAASEERDMQQRNIGFVLVCSCELECAPVFPSLFEYEVLPMSDTIGESSLLAHIDQAIEFIRLARKSNKNVLVHCWRGVSRSASIVIGYLIREKNMSLNKSLGIVRERRPHACPNPSLMDDLRTLEERKEEEEREREGDDAPLSTSLSSSLSSSLPRSIPQNYLGFGK